MHDVVRDSNAWSPLIVPGVGGRARVRVRRPGPRLAFSGPGQLSPEAPQTCLPAGRSENNAMLAMRRQPTGDVPAVAVIV